MKNLALSAFLLLAGCTNPGPPRESPPPRVAPSPVAQGSPLLANPAPGAGENPPGRPIQVAPPPRPTPTTKPKLQPEPKPLIRPPVSPSRIATTPPAVPQARAPVKPKVEPPINSVPKEPESDGPLELTAEVSQAPRRGGNHNEVIYVLLEIQGKEGLQLEAESAFVTMALDISGSVRGANLELACRAVAHLFSQTRQRDRAALIVFATRAQMLFDRKWEDKPTLDEIKAALREARVDPGDTLMGSGARMGLDLLKSDPSFAVKHLILVSDGATRLRFEPESMASEAKQFATTVSCIGVSEHCDHAFLKKVSQIGKGSYYRLDSPQDLPDVVLQEVRRAHGLALRGVELKVELGPEVRFRRVFRPNPIQEFVPTSAQQATFSLGNLKLKEKIQLLLELEVTPGSGKSLEVLRVECQTRRADDRPNPGQRFPVVFQQRASTAQLPAPEIIEIVDEVYKKLKEPS